MVLFIVGFAYAWSYLPGDGSDPVGEQTGKAHQILGTIIMGLAGLQVRFRKCGVTRWDVCGPDVTMGADCMD